MDKASRSTGFSNNSRSNVKMVISEWDSSAYDHALKVQAIVEGQSATIKYIEHMKRDHFQSIYETHIFYEDKPHGTGIGFS